MNKDLLSKRLFAVFLSELAEHRQTLERELMLLEQASDDAQRGQLLDSLFRAAHSLKGAARSVRAAGIERHCHRLEQHFHDLRSGTRVLDKEVLALLFKSLDELSAEAERLATPEPAEPRREAAPPAAPPKRHASLPPPEPARARGVAAMGERFFRVATDKVDELTARTSELTTLTSMLDTGLSELTQARELLVETVRELAPALPEARGKLKLLVETVERVDEILRKQVSAVGRSSERIEDDAQRLRLLPFAEACEGLDRAVRDLAQSLDKPCELVIEHNDVEIDRAVAQRLRDPLLHLLRNALAHGIEPRELRARRNKPGSARIVVRASLRGKQVQVEVEDDGGGFELGRLRARAQAMDLSLEASEEELLRYAFLPGFSTAQQVTELSGRGVGLDAVKRAIEAMHGTVDVSSEEGRGTRFCLRLPLTLSKLRCLFVEASGRPYAIPAAHVQRVFRFLPSQVLSLEGKDMLRVGDVAMPLASLANLLGLPERSQPEDVIRSAVVLHGDGQPVALLVEELGAEREITARALPSRVAGVRQVSAAAMVERGRIALVLHPQELSRRALSRPTPVSALRESAPASRPRLLVADDSATTRAVLKSVLEQANYDVTTAVDGEQALNLLGQGHFDALISDVEMPNRNGFSLTAAVRARPELSRLPVLLLTSLENEDDRLRGLEAGANAYLTKGAFDHRTLLDTLSSLL